MPRIWNDSNRSLLGSMVILAFNLFLEMAFDQFDEGFIPICIVRLGISKFWGVVWRYLMSFTNVLPALIYFTAFLVVYIQYKVNTNQEANTVGFSKQVFVSKTFKKEIWLQEIRKRMKDNLTRALATSALWQIIIQGFFLEL